MPVSTPQLDSAETDSLNLSVVRNDLMFRAQRKVGLIPAHGLGVARRAIFWSLFAWLPIAAWAWYQGRISLPTADESPLAHFGVHARLLVALPLFILGEAVAHRIITLLVPYFVTSGIVPPAEIPRFKEAIAATARLRDSAVPWIVILAIAVAIGTMPQATASLHEVIWAMEGGDSAPRLGFGAWWYLYVARTLVALLFYGWLWRLVLVYVLFWRISRLSLSIVPTHPDRTGGLSFIAYAPAAFSPVVLGLSCALAAKWAHDLVYHEVAIQALQWQMVGFVVIVLVVFLSPLLVFAGTLRRAKTRALLDMGAFAGRQGRLGQRRWSEHRDVEDDSVPDAASDVDAQSLYEAFEKMRPIPFTKTAVAPLVLAAALPMIATAGIKLPVADLLKTLLGALI